MTDTDASGAGADHPLPRWQRRANVVYSAAADVYVVVQQNLVGMQPWDLRGLHTALRARRARLEEAVPDAPAAGDGEQPAASDADYEQAVARFRAALDAAVQHHGAHTELDDEYRAELTELADAAYAVTTWPAPGP